MGEIYMIPLVWTRWAMVALRRGVLREWDPGLRCSSWAELASWNVKARRQAQVVAFPWGPRAYMVNIKEEYEPGVGGPLKTKHQRPNGLLISPFSGHFLFDLIMEWLVWPLLLLTKLSFPERLIFDFSLSFIFSIKINVISYWVCFWSILKILPLHSIPSFTALVFHHLTPEHCCNPFLTDTIAKFLSHFYTITTQWCPKCQYKPCLSTA